MINLTPGGLKMPENLSLSLFFFFQSNQHGLALWINLAAAVKRQRQNIFIHFAKLSRLQQRYLTLLPRN